MVLGFFAVLAIDRERKTLIDAYTYTSFLSGFIKIGQMLVIQRAVSAVELGEIEYLSDLLDGIRDQFLIQGYGSPFN